MTLLIFQDFTSTEIDMSSLIFQEKVSSLFATRTKMIRIYERCPQWSQKHVEYHFRKNDFIMPSANNDIIDICKCLKANSLLPTHNSISSKCKFLRRVLQPTEIDVCTLIICFSFEALPQWPKSPRMTLPESCASSRDSIWISWWSYIFKPKLFNTKSTQNPCLFAMWIPFLTFQISFPLTEVSRPEKYPISGSSHGHFT